MNFERGLLRRMGLASTAVGAFLYAVMPMAGPAQAGDDNMFSSVTNFFAAPFGGGKPADNVNNGSIDYRPRPTLVVPPSYNLPPPQPHSTRAADWPKDPDATALNKARADSRRPAPLSDPAAGGRQDIRVIKTDAPLPKDKCTTFGMPLCLPWGKHADNNGKLVLQSSMPRKYLTDPPVDYTEAVEIPKKGQAVEKKQAKAQRSHESIARRPPQVDYTPPGK